MSLSNSDHSISSSLPISELIKQIKHSFLDRDFNKVQNILMERDNDLKVEIENLTRDRDSAKEEVRLLERRRNSFGLEVLNFEECLWRSRRKCEVLEEKVACLQEETEMSKDREKRADQRQDNIFVGHTKMMIEKNRSILELQNKINELKTKNLENDQLLIDYEEKCKCLEIKVAHMEQEIEGLTREKLDAVKTIGELRAETSESNRIIDELKLKISESDEVVELHKRIEKGSSDLLTAKAAGQTIDIADLAVLYEKVDEPPTSKGRANSEFSGSKGKNDSSENAAEIAAVSSIATEVCRYQIATGSNNNGLSRKGDRNSVQRQTRVDDTDACTVNTPRVSQPNRDPQGETNKRKDPLDSGARATGTRLMSSAQCSTKSTHSPPPDAGDIIEMFGSGDETNTNENGLIPNRVSGSNPSKNKTNLVQSPLFEQRSKRNRTDTGEGFFVNSPRNNKRNSCPSGMDTVSIQKKGNQTPKSTTTSDRIDRSLSRKYAGDEAGPAFGSQPPVKKFKNDLIDKDSESSDDESLSDSRIIDLVASLRNKSIERKIVCQADMLVAIQQDTELCMNAVCALYRKEVIAKKQKGLSNSSKNGGFSPIDSVSGCALAEYLIDGDKELRLRKSAMEVKKQRPDVIDQCRKLANSYVEKLFEIYCSGEDRLFSQS